MIHYIRLILISFFIAGAFISCNKPVEETCIKGTILAKDVREILIGEKQVPVSEDGYFELVTDFEGPVFLDVSCGGLKWTLYLSGSCQLEMFISDRSLEGIQFQGDFQQENTYLFSTDELQNSNNLFLNENWTRIHWMDQSEFIAVIDSLKGEFIHHLESYSGFQAISEKFNDAWRAEIQYSFNTLILRYPERYMQFPPVDMELDAATLRICYDIT